MSFFYVLQEMAKAFETQHRLKALCDGDDGKKEEAELMALESNLERPEVRKTLASACCETIQKVFHTLDEVVHDVGPKVESLEKKGQDLTESVEKAMRSPHCQGLLNNMWDGLKKALSKVGLKPGEANTLMKFILDLVRIILQSLDKEKKELTKEVIKRIIHFALISYIEKTENSGLISMIGRSIAIFFKENPEFIDLMAHYLTETIFKIMGWCRKVVKTLLKCFESMAKQILGTFDCFLNEIGLDTTEKRVVAGLGLGAVAVAGVLWAMSSGSSKDNHKRSYR
jgi:predicted DNA-binding antitoxin AbrB/MazE fold protein